ncbi:MAG: type II toxin-antitoxin system HicB family antitoxin [Candidatus Kuenenia sp.]|nr:type II toxin-antitoxin system HicB family antitoxin [Candidatus Kuenenia sp.]
MRYYTFEIVIEKEKEDKGYYAYSPTLPGCFSNGSTVEETRKNIREAIELHVESLLKHSQKIPQAEKLIHVEEISIGLPS